MAYERKDNSGAAFKNRKKERETHADLTGDALIDGKDFWVNVWKKTDKNGDTFISLAFKPKGEKSAAPLERKEELSDEIPF
jgi:hypothetical protein